MSMHWLDEQLPTGESVFLDHVGFFVEAIEAAGPRLERLGFTVHPVSIHYNEAPAGALVRSGTANRLVTFDSGYLEVLSAVADTPLADQLRASLARYEGLHLIAFTHERVASRDPSFAAAGLPMQPTVALRRNLDTPSGPAQVQATVARCQPGVMEEGRAQMLTHGTPELIWLPEYAAHLNGVDALVEMLVVSGDPAEAVERYHRFTGCTHSRTGNLHHVDLDRGRLTFSDPSTAAGLLPDLAPASLPFSAAIVLRASDLERTRAALSAGGITPLIAHRDFVCVGPADALGSYIIFTQDIDDDIWAQLQACVR